MVACKLIAFYSNETVNSSNNGCGTTLIKVEN